MDVEARKYIRFPLHDNTFAALGNRFEAVGKVVDISIKGMTLSYICESNKAVLDKDFSQVDIFLSDNNFHLSKVPCKIVYDIQHSKFYENSCITIRRCGLQFGKLSEGQSNLLESLIANYQIESLNNSLSP